MGLKTSKVMEVFMAMKASGKSVFYGDLLRLGFNRAHIENAIDLLGKYGYTVEKQDCEDTSYTKLTIQ